MTPFKVYFLAFCAILLWSSAGIVGFSMGGTTNVYTQVLFILFSGFTTFGVISFFKRKKREILRNKKRFYFLTFVAATAFVLYQSIYYYSIYRYNPIEINTLNYTWIIFLVFLTTFLNIEEEKLSLYDLTIIFIMFIGVMFVTGFSFENYTPNKGHLLMIVGGFFAATFTTTILYIKKHIINDTGYIYFHMMAIVFPLYFCFLFLSGIEIKVTFTNLPSLLIISFGVFVAGQYMWLTALHYGSKITLPLLANFTPLLGTLWLALYKPELITDSLLIGTGIIILGNLFLNKSVKKIIIKVLKKR